MHVNLVETPAKSTSVTRNREISRGGRRFVDPSASLRIELARHVHYSTDDATRRIGRSVNHLSTLRQRRKRHKTFRL